MDLAVGLYRVMTKKLGAGAAAAGTTFCDLHLTAEWLDQNGHIEWPCPAEHHKINDRWNEGNKKNINIDRATLPSGQTGGETKTICGCEHEIRTVNLPQWIMPS